MPRHARWIWRKAEPTSLARFVNAACAADATPPVRLADGRTVHDAVVAGDRRDVIEALYAVLTELGIDYDIERYTADGEHSQVVRSPPEIVDRKRATCLDLALLCSGLALDLTLRPILVVLEGHALIAVVNSEFSLDVDPSTTADSLLGWIDQGYLIPLECTGAARGTGLPLSFEVAVERGRTAIAERPLLFAVDPYRLQRDHGLQPASCEALDRRWVLAVAGALTMGAAGVGWWLLPDGPPVFPTGVDAVVVPEIEGAPGAAAWLADSLDRAADSGTTFVDVEACGAISRMEFVGPELARRLDLDDPTNPASVDAVLTGTANTSGQATGSTFVEVAIEPTSARLAEGESPTLLALGSSPAPVDLQRDALLVFPELRVLPAVLSGSRLLDGGSDQDLAVAECLFALADDRLADDPTPRVQRYRASVHVLAANGLILRASSAVEDDEAGLLDRARRELKTAESLLDSGADLAVVRANGMAIGVMGVISDSGMLRDDVTQEEVDELVTRADEAAVDVDGVSDAAHVAMRSAAGRLHLAAYRRDDDFVQIDAALEVTAAALPAADRLAGAGGQPQVAELHEIRGLAHLARGDLDEAVAEFDEAAAASVGEQRYVNYVQGATARVARCADGDAGRVSAVVDETRTYLDASTSEALREHVDGLAELAAARCPG